MVQTASPSSSRKITLKAPLSGPLHALESVPDPVFAQKMVGDGISIDPIDQLLLAPCDGEVLQVHSAGHALTLLTDPGLEVMIHIGLDTVELQGEGFRPRVKAGDQVTSGDILIEFDADFIATRATSLLTQIVITNSEMVSRFDPRSGTVTAGEDDLIDLWLGPPPDNGTPPAAAAPVTATTTATEAETRADIATAVGAETAVAAAAPAATTSPAPSPRTDSRRPGAATATTPGLQSDEISIPNQYGLHARPAAVLANLAKQFRAEIRLQRGADSADAKSVLSLMELGVAYQDRIRLVARGDDAGAALGALVPLLAAGLGDTGLAPAPAPASVATAADDQAQPLPPEDINLLPGLAASPGLAIGTIFQLRSEQPVFEEFGRNAHDEQRLLDGALAEAGAQLEALQARLRQEADASKAAIFAAHQELLDDPVLLDIALDEIAAGKSAPWAWQQAVDIHAERLAKSQNRLLAERAADLRDLGARVMHLLTGSSGQLQTAVPAQSIVVTEELTPSSAVELDRDNVLGFCTVLGGTSSHVAILARSLDLPAVAGVDSRALDIANGSAAILDGDRGTLRINPSPEELQDAETRSRAASQRRQQYLRQTREPAITLDGTRVEVAANIGSMADIRHAVQLGAEGIGLLRTEFLFMNRSQPPSEAEQRQFYSNIAAFLEPEQPLVIRSLDVGGDKPLPYLRIPREDNPFLGERGIRISLQRPDIFRQQIRAILQAGKHNNLALMLPMIASLDELRRARAMVEAEQQLLGTKPVPLGIMVEVPTVALMASQFAREADFFSIGSNDLAQYTLAMDRDHPRLAAAIDGLNPGVLRLIEATVKGASGGQTWVGICGAIASDPQALPFLLGLGIKRLSCSVPAIPAIKARIRSLDMAHCRELAQQALQQDGAAQVRALYPDEN
ncbi:MAG: phosphoenolpyruvate--protein phosphotransferase [Gammaproteobacteria bacterium]|nr:phosphoenolpyruvate--protein phosphotransferase [Gammaproteobacteria bacterium]